MNLFVIHQRNLRSLFYKFYMPAVSKIKFILLLAAIMFLCKPFVGFSLRYQHYFRQQQHCTSNILVKSFTKRILEYSERSEFNILNITKKLADPALPFIILLAFSLNLFLPRLFAAAKTTTYSALAAIAYALYSPRPIYILSRKLTI